MKRLQEKGLQDFVFRAAHRLTRNVSAPLLSLLHSTTASSSDLWGPCFCESPQLCSLPGRVKQQMWRSKSANAKPQAALPQNLCAVPLISLQEYLRPVCSLTRCSLDFSNTAHRRRSLCDKKKKTSYQRFYNRIFKSLNGLSWLNGSKRRVCCNATSAMRFLQFSTKEVYQIPC